MPRFLRRNTLKRKLRYKRRLRGRFQRRRTNMRSVTKKVYALSKYIKQKEQRWQYKAGADVSLTGGIQYLNVTAPNQWLNMWDAPAVGATVRDTIRVNNAKMRLRLTMGNEMANCDQWVYLVRIKDQGAQVFNQGNGILTLTAGIHYDDGPTPTGWMPTLNRKYFTVLKKKYVGTGIYNGLYPLQTSGTYSMDKNWTWQIKYPFSKPILMNPTGAAWGAMQCARDPSMNLYIIIFSNNSGVDLHYPQFALSTIFDVVECD